MPLGPQEAGEHRQLLVDEQAGLVWTVDAPSWARGKTSIYQHRLTDERREIIAALRDEYGN